MLIQSINLKGLLSFGEATETLELRPLNLVIGPNGSGKSNLLEAIDLLRNAPEKLTKPIREGGGIGDWLWKGGENTATASLNVEVASPKSPKNLRYYLSFTQIGQRFEIVDERVETAQPKLEYSRPELFYHFKGGKPVIYNKEIIRVLDSKEVDFEKSILAQRKDPDHHPELTYLGQTLGKICLYREWSFGRHSPSRLPQKPDFPNDILESDSSNLGLVLNRLAWEPKIKRKLLENLKSLYSGIDDFNVRIDGGTVQLLIQEGDFTIPASRLSDGTLRFLSMLALLCDPKPPPLICLEEPELGLHPDILPVLAKLLIEASQRTQLIVTTHSDVLVDAMSEQPESIVVCEKGNEGTRFNRLKAGDLEPWLNQYRLGELWTRGDIGGTRW